MDPKPATIDAYLETINPEFRPELERIRAIVARLVPEAEETISYWMPTFKYRGRALVYFTASKKHMSFYPSSFAIEELGGRLNGYKKTAHAVHFTLGNRLPDELIEEMVRAHLRHLESSGR